MINDHCVTNYQFHVSMVVVFRYTSIWKPKCTTIADAVTKVISWSISDSWHLEKHKTQLTWNTISQLHVLINGRCRHYIFLIIWWQISTSSHDLFDAKRMHVADQCKEMISWWLRKTVYVTFDRYNCFQFTWFSNFM